MKLYHYNSTNHEKTTQIVIVNQVHPNPTIAQPTFTLIAQQKELIFLIFNFHFAYYSLHLSTRLALSFPKLSPLKNDVGYCYNFVQSYS